MYSTLVLVGTIYHLLAATNLHDLTSPHQSPTSEEYVSTQRTCVLLLAGVLWLHVMLKTLSEVAALSYFNISVNLALLLIVLYEATTHPPITPPTHTILQSAHPLDFAEAFAAFSAHTPPLTSSGCALSSSSIHTLPQLSLT